MSVMGMVMGAVFLEDRITLRRAAGIAAVLAGLLVVSGLEASSFTARTLLGDAMFIAAGTLWAGFGIVLHKHRLDPLLATAVIAFSALMTYVPAYLVATGARRLFAASAEVFWTEALLQGTARLLQPDATEISEYGVRRTSGPSLVARRPYTQIEYLL
jgi:drug/metabolite transporter (DMT)-like permease